MKIYIYNCKDNRTRAIIKNDNGSTRTVSYPRILMEEKLGRPLEPYEDVHIYMVNRSRLEVILMLNVD